MTELRALTPEELDTISGGQAAAAAADTTGGNTASAVAAQNNQGTFQQAQSVFGPSGSTGAASAGFP